MSIEPQASAAPRPVSSPIGIGGAYRAEGPIRPACHPVRPELPSTTRRGGRTSCGCRPRDGPDRRGSRRNPATRARHRPGLVDRMALAGVEGPDDTLKLPSRVERILEAVAASKRPTLVNEIRQLRTRFAAEPGRYTFPTGQTIVLGEWDLQRWVADALDSVAEIDAMVTAMPQLLDGDYTVLGQWALTHRVPDGLTRRGAIGGSQMGWAIALGAALSISPRPESWPAAKIPPVAPPTQPVFSSHTFTLCFLSFSPRSSAYFVGWRGRNALPKQAENVVVGSVTPTSVPATLAV